VRYESVPELLAVVKAPPTHFDILEGKEVVVNLMAFNSYGSYSRVADAAGVMSSFEIKRDRVHGSAHVIGALSLPPTLRSDMLISSHCRFRSSSHII
jgi:hypothetical protein